jgi:hypothetical protein
VPVSLRRYSQSHQLKSESQLSAVLPARVYSMQAQAGPQVPARLLWPCKYPFSGP